MDDKLILIVDDNEPTRQLLAGILGSIGYSTVQAEDGGSAAKVVRERAVDCAIVDQYMEPMGGFEFAKHLKDYEIKAPPMIMITAHETSDLLQKAIENGFRYILQKPVTPDRLAMTVERCLRQAQR